MKNSPKYALCILTVRIFVPWQSITYCSIESRAVSSWFPRLLNRLRHAIRKNCRGARPTEGTMHFTTDLNRIIII